MEHPNTQQPPAPPRAGERVRVEVGHYAGELGTVTGHGAAGSALVKLDSLPWPLPGFVVGRVAS
jgi:hypothetical protein